MGPAGLKPEIGLQFPLAKIIIAVNVQLVSPAVLIACSMGTVIKMNTAIAETGANLPIILYEITDTGIKSDIVPFVKMFIPDTKVPDITYVDVGSNGSFLKLSKTDHAEGKKNSKEGKFLLHVGWFCIKEQTFLLTKNRRNVKLIITHMFLLRSSPVAFLEITAHPGIEELLISSILYFEQSLRRMHRQFIY